MADLEHSKFNKLRITYYYDVPIVSTINRQKIYFYNIRLEKIMYLYTMTI